MLMHTPKKQDIIKLYVHFRATGKANHLYRKSWIFMQTKTVPIPISESYTLLEETERGSTIYKAYHNQEQQLVVLRKLRQTDQAIFRGTREAEFFRHLKHPHLPQILEFIEIDDELYVVTPFIPGKSFQQLLSEKKCFSGQQLLLWGMQLCSALAYLHSQKIFIHKDIQPSDILLTPEGGICLVDFRVFLSPGRRPVSELRSRRSDIYKIGTSLYHLALGERYSPLEQDNKMDELARILGAPFASVIKKATDRNPSKRFPSAKAMLKSLKSIPRQDRRYCDLLYDIKPDR